jgi:hypothetical protein
MILAWLLLLTGLIISAVAIYYSVVGLTAIFSAAVIPIIIMGSALEIGKLVCASWLKANWEKAPAYMKYYMITAVMILMFITSMGIFGFLSKAHNDQNLVSGDVQSKIAIYDEKIKTERENIDAARTALSQMDSQVNERLSRSTDDRGAERAVQIRRQQQAERTRLQNDISRSQGAIVKLNEERAPIAAEVRKVEAEVGPIKYIAKFIYGEKNADENMLEQAVTWIIILIVIVFDPLAVIMLLAAQMTFGWKRGEKENEGLLHKTIPLFIPPLPEEEKKPNYEPDDGPLTNEQLHQIAQAVKTVKPDLAEKIEQLADTHTETIPPTPSTALGGDITAPEETVEGTSIDQWNKMIEEAERAVEDEKQELIQEEARKYHPESDLEQGRIKPDLTEVIEPDSADSKKKTYMIRDQYGQIQIKNRE